MLGIARPRNSILRPSSINCPTRSLGPVMRRRQRPSSLAIPPNPASTWSIPNGRRATISAPALPSQRPLYRRAARHMVGGLGPEFDPAMHVPMPAGSFVTHFAKQVHWDGAKDEDAVLLIMGEGPATSTRRKRNNTAQRSIPESSARLFMLFQCKVCGPATDHGSAPGVRQSQAVAHHRHSLPLHGGRGQCDGAEGDRHCRRRRNANANAHVNALTKSIQPQRGKIDFPKLTDLTPAWPTWTATASTCR